MARLLATHADFIFLALECPIILGETIHVPVLVERNTKLLIVKQMDTLKLPATNLKSGEKINFYFKDVTKSTQDLLQCHPALQMPPPKKPKVYYNILMNEHNLGRFRDLKVFLQAICLDKNGDIRDQVGYRPRKRKTENITGSKRKSAEQPRSALPSSKKARMSETENCVATSNQSSSYLLQRLNPFPNPQAELERTTTRPLFAVLPPKPLPTNALVDSSPVGCFPQAKPLPTIPPPSFHGIFLATSPNILGTSTDIHGTLPNIHGTSPNIHGTFPDIHGTFPDNHGTFPNIHGTSTDINGTFPNIHGTSPNIPGIYGSSTDIHGTFPNIYGTSPDIPSIFTDIHGTSPGTTVNYSSAAQQPMHYPTNSCAVDMNYELNVCVSSEDIQDTESAPADLDHTPQSSDLPSCEQSQKVKWNSHSKELKSTLPVRRLNSSIDFWEDYLTSITNNQYEEELNYPVYAKQNNSFLEEEPSSPIQGFDTFSLPSPPEHGN